MKTKVKVRTESNKKLEDFIKCGHVLGVFKDKHILTI
jgi:hypothetical protein